MFSSFHLCSGCIFCVVLLLEGEPPPPILSLFQPLTCFLAMLPRVWLHPSVFSPPTLTRFLAPVKWKDLQMRLGIHSTSVCARHALVQFKVVHCIHISHAKPDQMYLILVPSVLSVRLLLVLRSIFIGLLLLCLSFGHQYFKHVTIS